MFPGHVRHLGFEELRPVRRGLVNHNGHTPDFYTLHNTLDGVRAEVVRAGLRRQAAHAQGRVLLT